MTDGKTVYNKDSGIYIGPCGDQDDGNCGSTVKFAQIELYTTIKYEHEKNSDGEKITIWGMEQNGKMLPGCDNTYWNSDGCNVEESCVNSICELTQNWGRSDLDNIQNGKYKPGDDKTSEVHTSVSVSTGGVGVSASIDHPKVERHVTYKEDEKILGEYDFTKGDGYDEPYADDDAYDGGWKNCQFGQVSTWTSDRPENSGDNIAPHTNMVNSGLSTVAIIINT